MKKYLVTGGAGFIGSHLVSAIIERGFEVRVLDNLSQGNKSWVSHRAEFIKGDITDLEMCKIACEGMDGVFHLAAMSRVAPSIDKFEYCTDQNIIGTQNVLIASRDSSVKRLIYTGSSSYYGNFTPPQSENFLPDCLNPYALSKYVGEQFTEMFTRIYNLDTLSLRLFNVYGPRQPRVGPYALVIGIFLEQLKNGESITIHGDGSQRRDFIYVKDVVRAFIKAMESDAKGMVLNIGSGTNYSIQKIADIISLDQTYHPRRAGDADETLADIKLAKKIIDWEPKISLEEGLKELKSN